MTISKDETDEELQYRIAVPNLTKAELLRLLRIVEEKHAKYAPGKVGWYPELHRLHHRIEEMEDE